MELRTIETFLAVASLQNFSKAAEQLGYSQSAVTVQIQKLEKDLNFPLFERIGKRVFLTEKGKEFIPYAHNIIRASRAALEFSQEEELTPQGKLRIGCTEASCTCILPRLMIAFHRVCPAVEVIVRCAPAEELAQLVENNELDLVLILDKPVHRSDVALALDCKEEVILVASPQQLQPAASPLPLSQLCCQPFIMGESGSACRQKLEQLLSERGLVCQTIMEINHTDTIIDLLKKGMGVSFLPRFAVEGALSNGFLNQIHTELPEVYLHHQLFYHHSKIVTKQMGIFIKLTQDFFSKYSAIDTPHV